MVGEGLSPIDGSSPDAMSPAVRAAAHDQITNERDQRIQEGPPKKEFSKGVKGFLERMAYEMSMGEEKAKQEFAGEANREAMEKMQVVDKEYFTIPWEQKEYGPGHFELMATTRTGDNIRLVYVSNEDGTKTIVGYELKFNEPQTDEGNGVFNTARLDIRDNGDWSCDLFNIQPNGSYSGNTHVDQKDAFVFQRVSNAMDFHSYLDNMPAEYKDGLPL